jgi:hypothetical protein
MTKCTTLAGLTPTLFSQKNDLPLVCSPRCPSFFSWLGAHGQDVFFHPLLKKQIFVLCMHFAEIAIRLGEIRERGKVGKQTLDKETIAQKWRYVRSRNFVLFWGAYHAVSTVPYRARFASYHHRRETLKRARLCTLLSLSHPHQSKSFSFRFIQY